MIEPGLNLLWAYRLELRCLDVFLHPAFKFWPCPTPMSETLSICRHFFGHLAMHHSPVRDVAWAISAHTLWLGIQICCVHAGDACS